MGAGASSEQLKGQVEVQVNQMMNDCVTKVAAKSKSTADNSNASEPVAEPTDPVPAAEVPNEAEPAAVADPPPPPPATKA